MYKAARPLPKGPERAPAYRIVVDVDRKEVARLAEALEVPGDVRERDGVWTAGGEGRSLTVDGATGAWSFTGAVPLKAGDVSEKEAKEAAAPVVEALGLEDAEVDAGRTRGGLRIVRVEPRQDGLPVDGRATEIGVGGRGALASGSGLLAGAAKAGGGAEYPVMSAGDALAALNERSGRVELGLRCSGPSGGGADKGLDKGPDKGLDKDPGKDLGKGAVEPGPGKPGAGGPDVVPPADGDPEGPGGAGGAGPCGPSGKRETVEVTDASFGLSAYPSEGRELLVPSWLFEVAAPGGEPYTVAHPAVEPEYLAPSGGDGAESAPAGPGTGPEEPARTATRVDEYGPGDRTLTVHFWGGVCSDYTASAEETGETVTIRISEKERNPGRACVAIAKAMTAEVALEKPVGDRKVLDEEGEPLPEGDPAEERR